MHSIPHSIRIPDDGVWFSHFDELNPFIAGFRYEEDNWIPFPKWMDERLISHCSLLIGGLSENRTHCLSTPGSCSPAPYHPGLSPCLSTGVGFEPTFKGKASAALSYGFRANLLPYLPHFGTQGRTRTDNMQLLRLPTLPIGLLGHDLELLRRIERLIGPYQGPVLPLAL